MSNFQLACDGTPGQYAGFQVKAQDDSGATFPATGNAVIDNYSLAYLVFLSNDVFAIVPKVTMQEGQATTTVTATFSTVDAASGIALPPFSVAVDLVAPPPPTQKATHLTITLGPSRTIDTSLVDPGSATIPVALA